MSSALLLYWAEACNFSVSTAFKVLYMYEVQEQPCTSAIWIPSVPGICLIIHRSTYLIPRSVTICQSVSWSKKKNKKKLVYNFRNPSFRHFLKAEMPSISSFQLLKCKHLLTVFVVNNSEEVWTVGTKEAGWRRYFEKANDCSFCIHIAS